MSSDVIKDNGEAYEKFELRNGPPLDYVASKLRASLESLHSLLRGLATDPPGRRLDDRSTREGNRRRSNAEAAFHYSLVAYLALVNRLAEADDHDLMQRLIAFRSDAFQEWLEDFSANSSVLG